MRSFNAPRSGLFKQGAGSVGVVVKKALIIVLVVFVAATGLPIMVGMSGVAMCPDCGPAVLVDVCALAAVAATFALLLALLATRLKAHAQNVPAFLHSYLLERPPRAA